MMMAVPAIESAGGVVWKMMNSNITAKTTYTVRMLVHTGNEKIPWTYCGVKSEGSAASSFTLKAVGQKRLHDFRTLHQTSKKVRRTCAMKPNAPIKSIVIHASRVGITGPTWNITILEYSSRLLERNGREARVRCTPYCRDQHTLRTEKSDTVDCMCSVPDCTDECV